MAIPLSMDFDVTTNVISPTGSGATANGLMLSTSTDQTLANIHYFTTLADVGTAYGTSSDEYNAAYVYFNGFTNCAQLPGKLLVVGIATSPTAGTLTSGDLSSVSISTMQALTASTITISVDGVSQTSASIDLSSETSQSAIATALEAALTGVSVAWNASTSTFVITSDTTGSSSSVSVADDSTIATGLLLTDAGGAVSVDGADIDSLTELMDSITNVDNDWRVFFAASELTTAQKTELCKWNTAQSNQFIYAVNDSSTAATVSGSAAGFYPSVVTANGYTGIVPVYGTPVYSAAVPAYAASIDTSAKRGRVTLFKRKFPGLSPNVTSKSVASALRTNGYNYYCEAKESSTTSDYFAAGTISGDFEYVDSYLIQSMMRSDLIVALSSLFDANQGYAFNASGYASVKAAIVDVQTKWINFGGIQKGVTLDSSETVQIKNVVGKDITSTLYSDGCYLYIPTQSGTNRLARNLAGCVFFYVDGEMIQTIDLTVTAVL